MLDHQYRNRNEKKTFKSNVVFSFFWTLFGSTIRIKHFCCGPFILFYFCSSTLRLASSHSRFPNRKTCCRRRSVLLRFLPFPRLNNDVNAWKSDSRMTGKQQSYPDYIWRISSSHLWMYGFSLMKMLFRNTCIGKHCKILISFIRIEVFIYIQNWLSLIFRFGVCSEIYFQNFHQGRSN